MTTYGVTPTGFVTKTSQVLLADLTADALATIDPGLDVSPDGPVGQVLGLMANVLAGAWALAAAAYDGNDPDAAEGMQLVSLASLTGTIPDQATPSSVLCNMTLNALASIPAGSVANVTGQPGNLWVLVGPPNATTGVAQPGPVVATTAGVYQGIFQSTTNGPNLAPAGSLTVITAPVSGWTAVTNPNDAVAGSAGYQGSPSDDTSLRQKREAELAASGASTVDALTADLLELPGMISATVYQNTSNQTDPTTGLPPKSYLALVWDGVGEAVSNDAIAQTIWNGKPVGILPIGLQSGTAIDNQGNSQIVYFERVAQGTLYISASPVVTSAFPVGGTAALTAQIVAWCNANILPGQTVRPNALAAAMLTASAPGNVVGVVDVNGVAIGFSPGPTSSLILPVSYLGIAVADTSRIVLTIDHNLAD